jgi:bifunctional DNase/RNase
VKEIFIYSTYDQILISRIIMKKEDKEKLLEIRTTDALAIAIIANAPIFTTAKILAESGMDLD